jgi:nitrate reductase gamma subunit
MHDLYQLVSGPLVWVAFIIFIGGSLYRLISMGLLAKKKDPMMFTYWDSRYALRSISHWIIPFRSENMKKHPVLTVVTFAFHICLIVVPLFLFAHIMLIKESWNISWWFISDPLADIGAVIVIGGCVFFLIRRMVRPEVSFLTSASDYLLLAIVAAPFITGFWAYHQWAGYQVMLILHILSGEIMLAAIPFTRLAHMLFFPISRGYMGSEFGAVKQAIDW